MDMSQGSTGVAAEVMQVDQDPGTTIVAVIPKDQNLLLIELISALLIIFYNFFPVSFLKNPNLKMEYFFFSLSLFFFFGLIFHHN